MPGWFVALLDQLFRAYDESPRPDATICRAGKELSYDYQLQVDEPITRAIKAENACHCGSSNCRGTMLDPSRDLRGKDNS